METYYITFKQTDTKRRNGWHQIDALDRDTATGIAYHRYSYQWSMLYTSDDWDPEHFPDGCLLRLQQLIKTPHYDPANDPGAISIHTAKPIFYRVVKPQLDI